MFYPLENYCPNFVAIMAWFPIGVVPLFAVICVVQIKEMNLCGKVGQYTVEQNYLPSERKIASERPIPRAQGNSF